MENYTHPEALVSCDWVQENLTNPQIRIVESNEDILLYNTGHIPGAVKVDWTTLQPARHCERHHCGLLRRQKQLVGMLCFLGVPTVRTRKIESDERWAQEMAGREPRLRERSANLSANGIQGAGNTSRDPRLPR